MDDEKEGEPGEGMSDFGWIPNDMELGGETELLVRSSWYTALGGGRGWNRTS